MTYSDQILTAPTGYLIRCSYGWSVEDPTAERARESVGYDFLPYSADEDDPAPWNNRKPSRHWLIATADGRSIGGLSARWREYSDAERCASSYFYERERDAREQHARTMRLLKGGGRSPDHDGQVGARSLPTVCS